ncbi:hypothetical protein TSMEX_007635, partial [Taenia solium]
MLSSMKPDSSGSLLSNSKDKLDVAKGMLFDSPLGKLSMTKPQSTDSHLPNADFKSDTTGGVSSPRKSKSSRSLISKLRTGLDTMKNVLVEKPVEKLNVGGALRSIF